MKIKTLTDAAADFRARALVHAYNSGKYDRPGKDAAEAIIDALRRALSDDEDNAPDIKTAAGQPRSYLCPVCRDTGAVGDKPCLCFKSYIYRECYGAADIDSLSESFDAFDLSLFDDNDIILDTYTQRDIMAKIKKYAQKYAAGHKSKLNLMLSGSAGLGKTYLLRCIAGEAKAHGADALLIDYPALHALFHAHRMGEPIDFAYLNGAGLLLIDDLGAESSTANVSVEYLFKLVDYRINAKLPTVFTTNVSNLALRYTEPVASRLLSNAHSKNFTFEGADLRRMRNSDLT